MHHHSEDKDITTPSSSSAGTTSFGDGTTPFKSQSSSNERRLSKDNGDDTFVSAMDLSSVLNSSQISTSSSDSNSSSASCHYSSSTSTDCSSGISSSTSTSVNSKSSSEKSAGGESNTDKKRKQKVNDNTTVGCEGSPVFATCTTFSSSSSTTSASTVRRSESWGALRSASIESSKSGGSDKENFSTSGADFRTSVSNMNESRRPHHNNPDTYHTPSASMHSISLSQSNSESQRVGDEAKSSSTNNLATNNKMGGHDVTLDSSTTFTDVKKDLAELVNKVPNIESLEFIESQQLKPSTSLAMTLGDEINNGKAEKDRRLSGIIEIMGIDMNDLASSESNASKEGSIGVGPTSKELAKAAKLARKPAKKRMWYQQIFSASYKSRSGDFKKLFKELPIKERLLVDYSCALQKEILVQGRMYVSQGYLSFHANIFGWETQTSIRLRDVTSITKEKTALVIPNAIQVIVDCGDKLFFTSFVTRDATYLMLFKLWQNALLEDGMPSKEIQRLIHSSYGEELVITSDDEIDESLSCKSIAVGDLTDNPSMAAEFEQSKPILISNETKIAANEMGPSIIITRNSSPPITKIHEELHNGTSSVGMEPSDLSDSSDSDQEFQAAEGLEELDSREIPVCPASHTEGREVINTAISCSIDQLFTMLFTSSKFYLDFHTSRKTFNIQQAPWEFGKDKKQTRQVSMTVSLNAVMGPKHSQITETQVMDTVSKPGLFYVIDCESVNAGVPYADTFYVTVHFCLSRISNLETRFVAVADIKYRKSVWGITKSIIEKNAWAGLEEFYSHMERALKEECTKMTLGGSPIPSPKHEASLPRRRPPRNTKGRAPPVPIGVTPPNRMGGGGVGGMVSEAPDVTLRETTTAATTLSFASDSSLVLKIILCILSALLLLNAFLYFKLNHLESSTTMSTLFPPPSFTLPGEMPQNHQDWLLLLQKQEALHRIELQKWHEILMSALKILHQAESDLEALKFHISSYSGGKYSVEMTKPEDHTSSHMNIKSSDKSIMTGSDETKTGEHFTKTFQEDIRAAEL